MLSRWTNFLTEDGEKKWRQFDQEFESSYASKEKLLEAWDIGWKCLFDVISTLEEDDLHKIIYIRNGVHTFAEAIFKQLAHYSYHIGQMAYVGRILIGDQWISLSIPKGSSVFINQDKLSQNKRNNS